MHPMINEGLVKMSDKKLWNIANHSEWEGEA